MAHVSSIVARLRESPLQQFDLSSAADQLCRQHGHHWRERVFTPLVTLRLFLIQILHGNTAITHLRQLSGMDFATSSYDEARARLPLQVLLGLLQFLVQTAQKAEMLVSPRLLGQRIFLVDGSSFSMSDTLELRQHFGLPAGQKLGVGYPTAKLMGLLDAATGLFCQMLALPLFVHDLRAGIGLHPCLRPGDILLGDRAFCSFAHFCLLSAAGVSGCFRLHQRRKTDRLGRVRWSKPDKCPAWMNSAQFALLPQFLDVRITRHVLVEKGLRTQVVFLASTLLDEKTWSQQRLAELYGLRWRIETCFDHLKTTMKMNVLKCQTLQGVLKELAVYLLVYNLVRLLMLQAAVRQQVGAWQISLIDACRFLAVRMIGLPGVPKLVVNPLRPGRFEPRMVRRRPKAYPLMKRPRAEIKARLHPRCTVPC